MRGGEGHRKECLAATSSPRRLHRAAYSHPSVPVHGRRHPRTVHRPPAPPSGTTPVPLLEGKLLALALRPDRPESSPLQSCPECDPTVPPRCPQEPCWVVQARCCKRPCPRRNRRR